MSAESCRWVQGSGRFPLNWPGSSALNSSRRQRMVWPLYRTKIEGALLRKGAKQGGTAEVTAFRLWNCRGEGPFVFLPERMFQMKNVQKYARNYFAPPAQQYHWSQREYIAQAPCWCSVDLRDGNQALVVPMDLEKKRSFFQFLCRLGFREIEVGFPAASDTEYQFVRTLIEHNLIPDDVTIQVITPAREAIIRRTFEALAGCKKAIVHLYNPTSAAQREQVFHKSRGQIIDIALQGVRTIADCAGRIFLPKTRTAPFVLDDLIPLSEIPSKGTVRVDLTKSYVVAPIWNNTDLVDAVKAFSDSGFENAQIDQVFGGAYIQELKLAIIDSPSDVDVPYILSQWDRGSIQMNAYSLKDLTKVLSTDGEKWYLQEENGETELPVLEPRMAILYNCGARRFCKD